MADWHRFSTLFKKITMAKQDEKNKKQDETPVYLTTDSTLQSLQEHEHDQNVDPRKDDTFDVSNTDLKQTDADRYGGPNKTGPMEHQP